MSYFARNVGQQDIFKKAFNLASQSGRKDNVLVCQWRVSDNFNTRMEKKLLQLEALDLRRREWESFGFWKK